MFLGHTNMYTLQCVLKHTTYTFCVYWNRCVHPSAHTIPVHSIPVPFQFICIPSIVMIIQTQSIALSRLAKI